jgi:hypothetical protein
LELAFDSRALRTICESEAQAKDKYGTAVAEILKHRLADLCAATSIKDLLVGQPRSMEGTDGLWMVLDLCKGYRMAFCANHPKNPLTETGQIDWAKVSRVKIMQIERDDA